VKVIGILLVVLGIVGIVYGGFTYTSHKKAVDLGPVQIDKTEHHDVPIPPLVGLLAVVAGGAMIYLDGKGR
jgi:hypothetical protein